MTYLRHSCSTYMEISTHSQVQWWHQQQTEWTLFCLPICHAPWLLVERALEGEDSACTGTRPYCSVRNAGMAKVPCLLNVWIHSLGPAYFSSHWGDQIVRQQTWATRETLIELLKMTLQMTRTYMFYFFIFNKKKNGSPWTGTSSWFGFAYMQKSTWLCHQPASLIKAHYILKLPLFFLKMPTCEWLTNSGTGLSHLSKHAKTSLVGLIHHRYFQWKCFATLNITLHLSEISFLCQWNRR